jgi:DNA-binding NarL/FixJ family response regulator
MRSELTERELDILKMMCLDNPEIAERLIVSLSTVKTHVHAILRKLGVDSRASALILALKAEIITIDDIVL